MSTPLLSPNSISTIRYDRKNHRKMIKHSLPSEINALPTDWTPNTKPSKIIENLLADKQKLHNQRLSDLKDAMIKIKVETENKIRNASENVKQCIFNTKKYVEKDMEKYTFDFNKTKATIRSYEEMFKRLKEMIAIRCNEMKLAITKHDSQLKQIELERMNSLKAAFRSAYEDLTKISYKLPHELQLYFENEIMLLNQMTLSNHYAYSELQSQLMNIALSNENIWLKKVDKLKFDYQRKYEEQQRNKDKYSSGDDIDDGVLTLLKVKAFTENLTMEIFQLESEGQGATNTIYNVLKRIYEGRFDEVHMIETDFVGLPKRDFWDIYDEVYRSMFEFESYEKVTEYTEVMMGRWRDVVDRLADEVEFCKQAVVKGLHIWDQHFVRQLEVTDIFSMDLWDLINTSDDDDDITMAALNKTIDTMRMGPNEDSLNKLMGNCKKLLDSLQKSSEESYQKHARHFDRFRDMIVESGQILYLEISYFVKCMPSDDDVNPVIFRGRRSRIEIVPPENKPILMKEFDADIKAMHNWLYGVTQYHKKNSEFCHENTLLYANTWIEKNYIIVYRHYQLKSTLIAKMYQEIFHYVYRVRLAEIIQHKKRLDEHILGINTELMKFTPKENIYAGIIFQMNMELKKLNKSLANMNTTTGITKQLQHFKTTAIDNLNEIKTQLDDKISSRFTELQSLNLEFIKHIKLFSEDGDYHIDEIANIKKKFTELSKNMTKQKAEIDKENEAKFQVNLKEINTIEEQFIEKSSEKISSIEFIEFTDKFTRKMRTSLKQETQALVQNYNHLSAHVERLESLAENNIGQIEYLDDFTSNCEYIQGVFKELYEKILQKEVFNLSVSLFKLPESNNEDKQQENAENHSETNAILENLQEKLEETNLTETVKVMFPTFPFGNDYMSKIVNILFGEPLEDLQTHAEEYYKKINPDDYETQLKTFMISHLAKCLYYQLQCDEILVEVTINYILELDELLSFMSDYYKRSIEEFIEQKLKQLSHNCIAYKRIIKQERETIDQSFQTLIDQLKPLHGHPNNKNLLEELTIQYNKIQDLAINQQVLLDQQYDVYETQVIENVAMFEVQMDKMETRLKKCIENFILLYIEDEHIFQQLRQKLAYFERIMMSGEAMITPSTDSMNIEIVDQLNSKLELLKLGLKVSSVEFSSYIKSKWVKASTIKEKYSSGDYLNTSNENSKEFDSIITHFRNDQHLCLKELVSMKNITEMCELWSNVWADNVEEIKALYIVKYTPKDKVEEIKVKQVNQKKMKK